MQSPILVSMKSQNVCQACRIGKQRCDKSLPNCARCVSKLICCNYAGMTIIAPRIVQRQCCLDLATDSAQQLLYAVGGCRPLCDLPQVLNHILRDANTTPSNLIEEYFATIHTWFPIIDENKSRSRHNDDALAFSMLSFFLITRRPCFNHEHSMDNLLYRTIKQMFMLQASTETSLEVLQVGLIVAYYACGHGLLRDAHLILTTCLAISHMLGLNFEDMYEQSEADNELSSCGWAIILLDRTAALSNITFPMPLVVRPQLGFSAANFQLYLDSKKAKWSFDVSSRVASLLGPAIAYSNDPRPIHLLGSTYEDTCDQVEKLVHDLISIPKTGPKSYIYCESTSLAFCTLLALQTANPGGKEVATEEDSKQTLLLKSTLRMIQENLSMATILLQEERASGVPVVAVCASSRAAAISVALCGGNISRPDLHLIRSNLQRFSERWMICQNFLDHIDQITA